MKELIPQGICFIQLWSAALFVQGIVEGVCGIVPNLRNHELTITPQLPADWHEVALTGMWIGRFLVDITMTPHTVTVRQTSMGDALTVTVVHPQVMPQAVTIPPDTTHTWTW
jgi:trehalose/maltose hydrolase-like predicted phosphorylase